MPMMSLIGMGAPFETKKKRRKEEGGGGAAHAVAFVFLGTHLIFVLLSPVPHLRYDLH